MSYPKMPLKDITIPLYATVYQFLTLITNTLDRKRQWYYHLLTEFITNLPLIRTKGSIYHLLTQFMSTHKMACQEVPMDVALVKPESVSTRYYAGLGYVTGINASTENNFKPFPQI